MNATFGVVVIVESTTVLDGFSFLNSSKKSNKSRGEARATSGVLLLSVGEDRRSSSSSSCCFWRTRISCRISSSASAFRLDNPVESGGSAVSIGGGVSFVRRLPFLKSSGPRLCLGAEELVVFPMLPGVFILLSIALRRSTAVTTVNRSNGTAVILSVDGSLLRIPCGAHCLQS